MASSILGKADDAFSEFKVIDPRILRDKIDLYPPSPPRIWLGETGRDGLMIDD